MDAYRRKIKQRIVVYILLDFLLVAILLCDQFIESAALQSSIVFAFQCGIAAAAILMICVKIIHYRKILEDDTKLTLQYNRENDERTKAIRTKAGMPMVLFLSALLILAGMVAGYWSEVVFATLVIAALVQLCIAALVKLYAMKTM
ncbi:MAG: hypothetical protein RSB47_03615 [Ruthenibacterium sp.]